MNAEQEGAMTESATEELRRMLDELEVEWVNRDSFNDYKTVWHHGHTSYLFIESIFDSDMTILKVRKPNVAQAIAATLGAGTCHDLAETPAYRDKTKFECSECGYEYSAVGGFGCDYGDEPDFNYCPNCGAKVVRK